MLLILLRLPIHRTTKNSFLEGQRHDNLLKPNNYLNLIKKNKLKPGNLQILYWPLRNHRLI